MVWINVTGWTPGMPIDEAMELVRRVWPEGVDRCMVVKPIDADILVIKPHKDGMRRIAVPFALLRANLAIPEFDGR